MAMNRWPNRETSNWWGIAFTVMCFSLFAVMIASSAGELATRRLMLGVLIFLFLVGGGILGLLAAMQFSQTHLSSEEQELADHHDKKSRPARRLPDYPSLLNSLSRSMNFLNDRR